MEFITDKIDCFLNDADKILKDYKEYELELINNDVNTELRRIYNFNFNEKEKIVWEVCHSDSSISQLYTLEYHNDYYNDKIFPDKILELLKKYLEEIFYDKHEASKTKSSEEYIETFKGYFDYINDNLSSLMTSLYFNGTQEYFYSYNYIWLEFYQNGYYIRYYDFVDLNHGW